MRIFLSGNEEVAKWHLPVVKSRAEMFAKRCKDAGLSQNAFAFSFPETKTVCFIQYVFGKLSVHIGSGGQAIEPESYKKQIVDVAPIWIKTHDVDVLGSSLGAFLTRSSVMRMIYESKSYEDNALEFSHTAGDNAILCAPESAIGDGLEVLWPEKMYSTERGLAILQYPAGLGEYVITATATNNFTIHGYAGSCFVYPGDGKLEYAFGWDFNDANINSAKEFSASITVPAANVSLVSFINEFWMGTYCQLAGGVTMVLPQDADVKWPFEGVFGDTRDQRNPVWIASEFTACAIVGSVSFKMSNPVPYVDSEFIFGARSTSYCTGNLYARVYNILSSGELSQYDIPILSRDEETPFSADSLYTFEKVLEVTYTLIYENDRPHYYYWDHAGPWYPSAVSSAPRNYISFVFNCIQPFTGASVSKSFAYDEAFGAWKLCSNDVTGSQLWSTECDSCVRLENLSGIGYKITAYSRKHDVFTDSFSYDVAKMLNYSLINNSIAYGVAPAKVILHKSGKIISFKWTSNASDDGIYRIASGVSSKLHTYAIGEMEPVYVSFDGEVVATKTAIYSGGTKIVDCTECCGVYLDHTHYVDKIGASAFVIKRISDGAVVDATTEGHYNFYELSEDSSVCVLSKFWMYEEDDKATHPAMVLDFADPVYRFEISDVELLQYMPEEVFYPTEENKIYGYEAGIPFGARYNYVCSCYCYNYSGLGVTGKKRHYIYTTPPGGMMAYDYVGTTALNATTRVRCLMCNTYKGSSTSNWINGELLRRKSRTVIAQYDDGAERRADDVYAGRRLNCYIYHHTGKILRRRDDGLTELPSYLITTTEKEIEE